MFVIVWEGVSVVAVVEPAARLHGLTVIEGFCLFLLFVFLFLFLFLRCLLVDVVSFQVLQSKKRVNVPIWPQCLDSPLLGWEVALGSGDIIRSPILPLAP